MTTEALRGRRWRFPGFTPVRFPAWRVWADARVRTDDAVLDLLAGVHLAKVALTERATAPSDRVPDLFDDEELPYKGGFAVTVEVGEERLQQAEDRLALFAFPVYVSQFDRLLKGAIQMLRRVGLDTLDPDKVDIGLSKKTSHLRKHVGVPLERHNEALWNLLVAVRNSVVHNGLAQAPVRAAWSACADEGASTDGQDRWSEAAGCPFPVNDSDAPLALTEREVVACQQVLDLIGVDLSKKLRARVDPVDWARLVIDEYRTHKPEALGGDEKRNVRKLMAWCSQAWGVEVSESEAQEALATPLC